MVSVDGLVQKREQQGRVFLLLTSDRSPCCVMDEYKENESEAHCLKASLFCFFILFGYYVRRVIIHGQHT